MNEYTGVFFFIYLWFISFFLPYQIAAAGLYNYYPQKTKSLKRFRVEIRKQVMYVTQRVFLNVCAPKEKGAKG